VIAVEAWEEIEVEEERLREKGKPGRNSGLMWQKKLFVVGMP
jgi:hypothetical protein